jgi:mRNA interferase MazF
MVDIERFDVGLINLNTVIGSEMKKIRPCLIVSPDSMNKSRLKTIIIAPLTSTIRLGFPTRVISEFQNKKGHIALDQLRVIDRERIIKVLGKINNHTQKKVLHILQTMFS